MALLRLSSVLLGFAGASAWVAGCTGGRPGVTQYGSAGNDGSGSSAGTTSATAGGATSTSSGGTSNTTGIFGDAGCVLANCEGGAAGQSSTALPICGDGLANRSEEKCDDGNFVGGDGCTSACDQIEANYVCPTPGQPCVTTVVCGDGRVTGSETCDDGKDSATSQTVSDDG
jgi:cysteine-rich repeat protein